MNLNKLMEKLTDFEPNGSPFISIYLNAEPDNQGRDKFDSWLKKVLSMRTKGFDENSAELESYEKDVERIMNFAENEVTTRQTALRFLPAAARTSFLKPSSLTRLFRTIACWFLIARIFFRWRE